MDDLIQRLLLAETDFLVALRNGPQILGSYRQTLSALPNVLSTATTIGNVSTETLFLANSIASRISKVASCFLDIKHEEDLATVQLHHDCDTMLQSMIGLNLDSDGTSSTKQTSCMENLSLYPASAYQWLLENLHNPYPTGEVKSQIAASSACLVSSVNTWFTNARRRIGWTALCRDHFSSCKADMLDAAYRALVEEDPQRMLSPELRHSFVAMKVAAEGLYSSTFTRGVLAGLNATTEEYKKPGKYCQVEQLRKTIQGSHHSHDRSTTPSPVPVPLMDESEKEGDISSPIIAGLKRRRASIEPTGELTSVKRPTKRLRRYTTSRAHLPSPPGIDHIDVPSDDSLRELSSVYSTRPKTDDASLACMQRLSNPDTWVPKHSCGSIAIPPLHTVSGPLPRSSTENEYSASDWFNANFDTLFTIPPPVDSTEPDFSALLEVELFRDYNIPGNPKCPSKYPPAHTCTSPMTDISNLDSLLQSFGSDTIITTLESGLSSDITDAPYMTSLDILDTPQTGIDWAPLLGGLDAPQCAIQPIFSQHSTDTLPLEAGLLTLQPPHTMLSVESPSDIGLKQAKLHQLHVMQEAVWRMEQELRSEGVVM